MPGGALVRAEKDREALRAGFAWPKPARFNIADAVCDAWARADPGRLALRYLRPDGEVRDWTYAQLARASARFGEALKAHGIRRGDRVAVLLPQTPEAAVAHLAA